jgi:hypothetical protein
MPSGMYKKLSPFGIEWDKLAIIYSHYINFLGHGMNTIKENTETLLQDSTHVGLEVNTDKTKHTFRFRHRN